VVNATIRASIRPRKELPVGWKAKSTWISHHLFPHLTERISANIVHRYQFKTAPPYPPTSGAAFQPMETGRGVDDGVRKRMKDEKRWRRAHKKE
jgi:hypothetical protein